MVDIVNDKKNGLAQSNAASTTVDERLDQTNFPSFKRDLPRIDLALRYGGMPNTSITGKSSTSFQSRPTSLSPETDTNLQKSSAGEGSLSLIKKYGKGWQYHSTPESVDVTSKLISAHSEAPAMNHGKGVVSFSTEPEDVLYESDKDLPTVTVLKVPNGKVMGGVRSSEKSDLAIAA